MTLFGIHIKITRPSEFFGTGAHDPDALGVVIIGLPISKHFQPEC